jgi:hypothetical protein
MTAKQQTPLDDAVKQGEEIRSQVVAIGKEVAELTVEVTEKAVKQGTELWVKATDMVPNDFFKNMAKLNAEYVNRASDLVAQQSRDLLARL